MTLELSTPVTGRRSNSPAAPALSTRNCFDCDNRYGVCLDNAIRKVGDHYEIDYDYCKGCGLCVAECPSGAVIMLPERT